MTFCRRRFLNLNYAIILALAVLLTENFNLIVDNGCKDAQDCSNDHKLYIT